MARRRRRAEDLVEAALADPSDAAEAVSALRRALRLVDVAPAAWPAALATRLADSGAPHQEVDDAYRTAIVAAPNGRVIVDRWAAHLRERGEHVEEHLISLQRASTEPLVGVLLRLLAGPDPDRAISECSAAVRSFLDSSDARHIRQVWADVCALRPIDPASRKAVRRIRSVRLRLFFILDQPIRLTPLKAADPSLGLSPDALQWWRHEFCSPDHPPGMPETQFVSVGARKFSELNDPLLAFQTRIVRDRALRVRDPHTGVELEQFDSFIAHAASAYSFGDQELSVMISGGGGNKAIGVLLARQNVVLDFEAELWHHFTATRLALVKTQLVRRAVKMHAPYVAAIENRADRGRARQVVLMGNVVENPAHHLWNFLPAVESIVDLGLAANVDEVRTGGSEFYGPLVELFPELSGCAQIRGEGHGVRDPYPYSPDHVIVAPGSYHIRRATVDRLVGHMAQLPGDPKAVSPPDPSRRAFPVVWIGLRLGSRSWIGQDRELPRLIDRLHDDHPQALIVLDGFSYPVGESMIPDAWESTVEALHGLSQAIRAAVRRPDHVIDMVGNTLRESVLWAAATDVYLTPNGSSQHKVGWLTDGVGIAYGPPSLAADDPDRRPGAYESEGRTPPVLVVGEPVTAGDLRSASDRRPNLANIRLDLDEVTATMLRLIDESVSRRGPAGP